MRSRTRMTPEPRERSLQRVTARPTLADAATLGTERPEVALTQGRRALPLDFHPQVTLDLVVVDELLTVLGSRRMEIWFRRHFTPPKESLPDL